MGEFSIVWIVAAALIAIVIVFCVLYFYRQKKGVKEPLMPVKTAAKGDEKPKANTYTFAEIVKDITVSSSKEDIDRLSKFLATYKAPSSYYPREKEQLYRVFHDCVAFNENIPTGTKEGFRLFLKDNIGVDGLEEKPEYVEKKENHIALISSEKAAEIKKNYDAAVFDFSKSQFDSAVEKAEKSAKEFLAVLLDAADIHEENTEKAIELLQESKKIPLGSCTAYKKLVSLFGKAEQSTAAEVASDVFFIMRKETELFFDNYVKVSD